MSGTGGADSVCLLVLGSSVLGRRTHDPKTALSLGSIARYRCNTHESMIFHWSLKTERCQEYFSLEARIHKQISIRSLICTSVRIKPPRCARMRASRSIQHVIRPRDACASILGELCQLTIESHCTITLSRCVLARKQCAAAALQRHAASRLKY